MKSILSDKCCKKEEKPFPKLMMQEDTNCVVLMATESGLGFVVNGKSTGGKTIGESSELWPMYQFTDYVGDVCLTND